MNLLCGVLGVISTFRGDFDTAFYLMLAAAVCDFCDGLSARLLHAYSDIGKELDSLADMVSFGLLPALMLHRQMMINHDGSLLCYIPLVIVIFSALRLAKFNIDDRQSENFLGLATPACAIWCSSLVYLNSRSTILSCMHADSCWFIPTASVILAFLLVSEIPMFSMKFKKGSKSNVQRYVFIGFIAATAAVTAIFGINWSFIVFMTMTVYILWNALKALFVKKQ